LTAEYNTSCTSVDLPEPLTPVMQVSVFQGDLDVDALEVVLGRTEHAQFLSAATPPARRDRDREIAAEILRGQRALILQQVLERAREHHAPALLARPEAQIDNRVADANHVLVVLDDQHGIALVAELPEDVDEAQIVARVQTNRRLVEHVQRIDERRAERGRQIDALRFAAGQRRRQPVERQVIEPHVAQELEPLLDFLEDLVADGRFLFGQLQRLKELLGFANRVGGNLIDRPAANPHITRLRGGDERRRIRGTSGSHGSGSGRRGHAPCTSSARASGRNRGCRRNPSGRPRPRSAARHR
jgi:hypothetical protein